MKTKSEYHNLKDLIVESMIKYNKRKGVIFVNTCINAENVYKLLQKQDKLKVYIYISKNIEVENDSDTDIKIFEKIKNNVLLFVLVKLEMVMIMILLILFVSEIQNNLILILNKLLVEDYDGQKCISK